MSSSKAPGRNTIGKARMDRITEIETTLSELRAARQQLVEWYQGQDKVSLEQLSSSGSDARRRRGKEKTETLTETARKYEAQLQSLDKRIQDLEVEKEEMRGLGLAE
jgi:prefoldin subunit 5